MFLPRKYDQVQLVYGIDNIDEGFETFVYIVNYYI